MGMGGETPGTLALLLLLALRAAEGCESVFKPPLSVVGSFALFDLIICHFAYDYIHYITTCILHT